jgi:hypothetical protein
MALSMDSCRCSLPFDAIALQKPLPRSATRTSGQKLAHSDDLRFVPSAASRRWDAALIEDYHGRSRGQRGQLFQERPKPRHAARRRLQDSESHAPPESSGFTMSPLPVENEDQSSLRFSLTVAFFGICRERPSRSCARPPKWERPFSMDNRQCRRY